MEIGDLSNGSHDTCGAELSISGTRKLVIKTLFKTT